MDDHLGLELALRPRRAKLDFRRKRGLIEEINRSVQSVEQDLDVIRAMGARQRVLDGPLDYAPSNIDDPNEAPKPPGGTPAPTKPAPEAKPAPETKEP